MVLHNDPLLNIYFGGARDQLNRDFLNDDCSQNEMWSIDALVHIKKLMHLEALFLLKQRHSSQGVIISTETKEKFLSKKDEGDFLVTRLKGMGLAVYTADCLPIIIYDSYTHAVGICHAGWRGSVDKVAIRTLEAMQKSFATDLDHVRIFFGPSARVCCYEVGEEFRENFTKDGPCEQVLVSRGEQFFFDLPLFNRLQLESYGVNKEAFHCTYNECTIENPSFCSVRRKKNGNNQGRQLTIVMLK